MTPRPGILTLLLAAASLALACSRTPPPKQYELKGQILSLKPENLELLVRHEDIKGFMPAMTMPYKVAEASLLAGKEPGDLITATLVVGETEAHLSAITKIGHEAIAEPPAAPEVSAMEMVKEGRKVPDAPLIDETGRPRPLGAYRGHRLALTFIYTRCPDPEFCPLMNQNFLAVQKLIESTPELADAQLLSISLDPEFDTPAVLKEQALKIGADPKRWHFAVPEKAVSGKFSALFGVTATSNGTPTLIHNLGTAVIDPDGQLVKLYSNNRWTPAELIADLKAAPAPRH